MKNPQRLVVAWIDKENPDKMRVLNPVVKFAQLECGHIVRYGDYFPGNLPKRVRCRECAQALDVT